VAETVTLSEVTKTYPGASSRALDGVSLTVDPGTFLVLLGPSGSGKTTLLRCLAGIERVSSGSVAIGARTVADGRVHLPPDQRDLSMVFQDYALWPHLTARENVAFALRRRGLSRAACRARAATLLERVGLDEFAGRYPNELSGGQQQRVALARALVADTGLILCDEPLSNLDADLRERMRVEISSLVREAAATTVYITHDQAEAFALADVVGVLRDGELVQYGTPEDVYNHPATPFVARFTGLAGELPVRIVSGDQLTVTVAGGTISLPGAAGNPDGLRPGDEALLAIRPTGVRVTSPDDEADHLTGTVADVAFRGRGYELAVDLPRDPSATPGAAGASPAASGRLTGVFARRRPLRGERIGLRLEPSGCHLFPAGAPAENRKPEQKAVAG
jgi:ABC-type Fe3+/spermidine/putrescine transport system ATPase subunit